MTTYVLCSHLRRHICVMKKRMTHRDEIPQKM
jgi:hypothetical protein